jgi:hypothetical protein
MYIDLGNIAQQCCCGVDSPAASRGDGLRRQGGCDPLVHVNSYGSVTKGGHVAIACSTLLLPFFLPLLFSVALLTHAAITLIFQARQRPHRPPNPPPLLCVPPLPLVHVRLTEKCRRSRRLHPLHADVAPASHLKEVQVALSDHLLPRLLQPPALPSPAPMQKPNPPSYVRLYCYRGPCDITEPRPQAHRLDRHLTKWNPPPHPHLLHTLGASNPSRICFRPLEGFEALLLYLSPVPPSPPNGRSQACK